MRTDFPVKTTTVDSVSYIYSYDNFITNFDTYEYSLINSLLNIGKHIDHIDDRENYRFSQSFNEEKFYNPITSTKKLITIDPYNQSNNFDFNEMKAIIFLNDFTYCKFYGYNGELKYNIKFEANSNISCYKHLGNNSNTIHIAVEYDSTTHDSHSRSYTNNIYSINPYTNSVIINELYGPILIDNVNNYVYSAYMLYNRDNEQYELAFQLYNMNNSSMDTVLTGLYFKTKYVSNVAFYHSHLDLEAMANDINYSTARSNSTIRAFENNEIIPEVVPSS